MPTAPPSSPSAPPRIDRPLDVRYRWSIHHYMGVFCLLSSIVFLAAGLVYSVSAASPAAQIGTTALIALMLLMSAWILTAVTRGIRRIGRPREERR